MGPATAQLELHAIDTIRKYTKASFINNSSSCKNQKTADSK
jgi:hypothetical protein